MMRDPIAIVGMAGRFPGAGPDLGLFWEAVSQAREFSRDVPPERWLLSPQQCLDPRLANPDTVYTTRGYYLDPFQPDLSGLSIDPSLVVQLDPLFHLVLDLGSRVWQQAKMSVVDRRRVGVVMGNICLPTDRSNDLCREYLGGEPQRTHGLNRYVAGLPAGLLAQALELGGGTFTLDAACASSLYALKLAADELLAHRADAMIAGGVSRPDCLYTQMGFAQLRALSPSGRCSPFDARADGLLVGEGGGLFILKRLSDALRHGDHIYAILAGAGLSNDMHGNLLAPAQEGQLRAMRRAYQAAGWKPTDVDLIECHATGTPVGDAVEFSSLRELWTECDWVAGQCVIGSVKSTVGHLLTGAGAAALIKVLLALQNEQLPPQAHFESPAPGLSYHDGPFRVLQTGKPWPRRIRSQPRKAAMSGFGFGGVNAHLLVEEWVGIPPTRNSWSLQTPQPLSAKTSKTLSPSTNDSSHEPIAIVGVAAHIGPWVDQPSFLDRVLAGKQTPAQPKQNGWQLAETPCPPGYYIDSLPFPIDRFRIPPREVEETLPQQLLMLLTASRALADAEPSAARFQKPQEASDSESSRLGDGHRLPPKDDPETGVFIGLGLDLNTTNFHLRWSRLAAGSDPESCPPALTANRTMGALGSIAASRIARAFHFGGPSFTVCSEEASAGRALQLAVRALQAGDIRRAVVGGVDLHGDPRMVLPSRATPGSPVTNSQQAVFSEGSAAVVLKRLADAERDGDRIYAVIRGVGVSSGDREEARREAIQRACEPAGVASAQLLIPPPIPEVIGDCGAASAAADCVRLALALYTEMEPTLPGQPPRYWLHDRERGPRTVALLAQGADASCYCIVLEEYAKANNADPLRRQPFGPRSEALFIAQGHDASDLINSLTALSAYVQQHGTQPIEALGRGWYLQHQHEPQGRLAAAIVARSADECREQIACVINHLQTSPTLPLPQTRMTTPWGDRVFYSPQPLGAKAKTAFVFPGSGNHFDQMGRGLGVVWPAILRQQQQENRLLRSQFAPEYFWADRANEAPPKELMFGQVAVGSLVADLLAHLGVRADAMIGLSLGESAGLFGLRIWRDRDEMYRRMQRSTLFQSDLAPPYNAARQFWGLSSDEPLEWTIGVIGASAEDVRPLLRPGLRAYLLIVTTPQECVIGGIRADVERLAQTIGKLFIPLQGVTIAHCEAGRPVEMAYRELHTLPVHDERRITLYSAAWGRKYRPDSQNCADSITAGLVGTIDFPAVVEAAYRDGVRVFLEVGPGNSCTRMIHAILGDRRHLTRALHVQNLDAVTQVLSAIAQLAAERIPLDLAPLYDIDYSSVAPMTGTRQANNRHEVVIPVGLPPVVDRRASNRASQPEGKPLATPRHRLAGKDVPPPQPTPAIPTSAFRSAPAFAPHFSTMPQVNRAFVIEAEKALAHGSYLRLAQSLAVTTDRILEIQAALLQKASLKNEASQTSPPSPAPGPDNTPAPKAKAITRAYAEESGAVPRSLSYEQCNRFAVGKVSEVLGPLFAEVDTFPTRVRLPEGPLQLVDRILAIEGQPRSMGAGRVITEHTVHDGRWYLDNGRIPTSLAVEAGQADLFLSGFLGIDFETRGLAVYRLLDAVVTFHRSLPRPGDTITYDIHIDGFTRQGDTWLFRFWFDGTVRGEPLISMRNGVAGFFTAEALAAGKGIVHTPRDLQRRPGKRSSDWRELVPCQPCSIDDDAVDALRRGDLTQAFGPLFSTAQLRSPMRLPGGMLRLVDRVTLIEPHGGRFGIGWIQAEYDLKHPEWFIECHFVDDKVMPGTLMYECCLHTLRILLMRLGWVCESTEAVYEPVPGVKSRLKCRGQVTDATKRITYEITVKELGYRPEPYCLADALMYADGKPIVEISDMSLRMSGLTRERLEAIWGHPHQASAHPANDSPVEESSSVVYDRRPALYGPEAILAFSNGNPSEAFGEPYRVFDRQRQIARLPGPPFQFLDRITAVTGEPFVLKAGAACTAQYDVPPDAWYFSANRSLHMPFSVLLEVALQPCGWLAAYCGSALTSPVDLRFRNLGGKATQYQAVTPTIGTLTTHVRLTSVSASAGMIIQHFDMSVKAQGQTVYEGTTYFGFFSAEALANQIGLRDAKVPWPTPAERTKADRGRLPQDAPFPAPQMRMIDRIEAYIPDGGPNGLGLVIGTITVDPSFWFFDAHFYQDPVWPGSLGLESFLQLLKYAAWRRWGDPAPGGWQAVALNQTHSWIYRGQVIPTDKEVTVILEVTAIDESKHRLRANGFLMVDGRVIYQMTDFSIE